MSRAKKLAVAGGTAGALAGRNLGTTDLWLPAA